MADETAVKFESKLCHGYDSTKAFDSAELMIPSKKFRSDLTKFLIRSDCKIRHDHTVLQNVRLSLTWSVI